jgi:hypothetical protein
MKERPILFSGEMVRAILDGRKTMTRRVIKPQPEDGLHDHDRFPLSIDSRLTGWWGVVYNTGESREWKCPYGQPGDRLWVRETWGIGTRPHPYDGWIDGIEYRADVEMELHPIPSGVEYDKYEGVGWRPSIHMPRWASRITLEITAIRVERLQDITEADALREGIAIEWRAFDRRDLYGSSGHMGFGLAGQSYSSRGAFQYLWDGINAKRSHGWEENPWVWVIEFKKI